jgi:endonuclease/exonuclease/phosphatase family metal-dependent hydrolase
MTVLTGGRATHGNLLLGGPRVSVRGTSRIRLPRSGRRHRRAVAVAQVVVDGLPLTVAGTHLSLDPLERAKQARHLVGRLAGVHPLVLAADLNDVPGSSVWRILTEHWRDAHATSPVGGALTFPARDPNRRLDAIFVSPDCAVTGSGVPLDLMSPAAASDHLPVIAELEL